MPYSVLTALPETAFEYTNNKERMKTDLKEIGSIVKLDRKPIVVAQVRQLEARYGWICKIFNDSADQKSMYVQHTANIPQTEQQKQDNTLPPATTPPATTTKTDNTTPAPTSQKRETITPHSDTKARK